MEKKKQPSPTAPKGKVKEKKKRKVSKTWEAAQKLKGSLIVNDPALLL